MKIGINLVGVSYKIYNNKLRDYENSIKTLILIDYIKDLEKLQVLSF